MVYYYIFAVPMRNCVGKRSCMSSTFPIAIVNGTCSLRSAKTSIRSVCRVLFKLNSKLIHQDGVVGVWRDTPILCIHLSHSY